MREGLQRVAIPQGQPSPAADQGRFLVSFEVDALGRVSRWTLGAAQVLGWSAGQAIGQFPPVPPPWDGVDRWTDLALAPPLLDASVVWRAANGVPHEMAVSTSPSIAADGTVLGVTVSARDISARSQVHEQLAVYARDVRETYGRELHRLADLEASYHATVEALAVAVESKDDTTGNHIRRVCRLGMHLAKAHLGASAADDPQLAYGFLLHDVGKLAIPDAVLNKPGKLDPDEWALIQRHPVEGSRILAEVPFLDRAMEVVLHHHERWDGGGYPSGQRGEEIPVWARLFSIVDSVDAMTSDRPYRAGLSLDQAVVEIQDKSGSQFDPACVATFTGLPRNEIQAMLESHDIL